MPQADVLRQFVDGTGRPGPSTWESGSYPAGQDDYPVTGVSWYEAAAYAAFVGKQLPTVFHWSMVADQTMSGAVVPASNFSGKGPAAGRQGRRLEPLRRRGHGRQREGMGVEFDQRRQAVHPWRQLERTAVHVHRWRRQNPMARETTFGFRCMKLVGPARIASDVAGEIAYPVSRLRCRTARERRDLRSVSEFLPLRPIGLGHACRASRRFGSDWRFEKVSFAAAYGGERVAAYVFLPKKGTRTVPDGRVFSGLERHP